MAATDGAHHRIGATRGIVEIVVREVGDDQRWNWGASWTVTLTGGESLGRSVAPEIDPLL